MRRKWGRGDGKACPFRTPAGRGLISSHGRLPLWLALRPVLSRRLLVGVAIGLENFLEAYHAFQLVKVGTVHDRQKR